MPFALENPNSWEPVCFAILLFARQFTKSDSALNHTQHGALSACAFTATDVFLLQCIYAVLLLPKAYGCKGCLWPVASAGPLIGGRPRRVEWGLITRRVRYLGTCSAGSSKMEATAGCRTAPQPAELSGVIHAGLIGPMAKEDCYNVANVSPG